MEKKKIKKMFPKKYCIFFSLSFFRKKTDKMYVGKNKQIIYIIKTKQKDFFSEYKKEKRGREKKKKN